MKKELEKIENYIESDNIENYRTIYHVNETMQRIGESSFYTYCVPGGEYSQGFKDILTAHKDYPTDALKPLIDCFQYGMMCGIEVQRKRAQRAKQRKVKK